MQNRTQANTHSMGKRATDKTGKTSASGLRVLSAWEHNGSTLASLDDDDEAVNRAAEARDEDAINALSGIQKKRGRPPGSKNKPKNAVSSTASADGAPPAKRKYTKKKRTINNIRASNDFIDDDKDEWA